MKLKALHYAYPTSDVAEMYDCTLYGCFYITLDNEIIKVFRDDDASKKQRAVDYFKEIYADIDSSKSLNLNVLIS